jgi:hypothetical protein
MRLADRPLFAYGVIVGTAALVVSPALSSAPRDSFPLSTYPMFSSGRKDATVSVDHAVAIDGSRGERPIPPRLVGSDEVLQARATIARAAKRGEGRVLCRAIAARVAADEGFAGTARVELRATKLDAVQWFEATGEGRPPPSPISVKLHARCEVGR